MREHSYMSRTEAITLMLLDALTTKLEEDANDTTNPAWRKKMKTAATYLNNIITERVALLDMKQRKMLARKSQSSQVKVVTRDESRTTAWQDENRLKKVTIDAEDLFDLGEWAYLECFTCEQGCRVKDCKMRELYHRVGFEPIRTDVKDGECEFRSDNIQRSVGVDYKAQCRAIL